MTGLKLCDYQALMKQCLNHPYGLANAAFEYTLRTPHLFVDLIKHDHVSDLIILDLPRSNTRYQHG